jgi:hypothetical protein
MRSDTEPVRSCPYDEKVGRLHGTLLCQRVVERMMRAVIRSVDSQEPRWVVQIRTGETLEVD